MRINLECLAGCFLIVLLATTADAGQKTKRKLTITDPSKTDQDFAFQGEYSGPLLLHESSQFRCTRKVGLQVVALGDGKFSAVEYAGGLPGGGWYGGQRERLHGQRRGDVLTLQNAAQHVTIRSRRALVATPSGEPLGELVKVRRRSRTMGSLPPPGALVLFDGTNTNAFNHGKMTDDRLLQVGTELKQTFRDFAMHLEFRLPYMPYARGQGRANSGVYLQSRYEVQVLDSFGLEGKFNECGALYRYRKPDVNMCLPPLVWQTYDIHFRSPRFDCCGNKVCSACLTLRHNGVTVHRDFAVQRKTGAGKPESPQLLPIKLQNHGNPVVYRNIWLVEHCASDQISAGPGQYYRPRWRAIRRRPLFSFGRCR